jgi:hypothetical protein
MGVVTLLCVYHVARLMVDMRTGLVAMLLTASIPMFVHVSASVNNDNLNITMNALAIALLVHMWQDRRINRQYALLLGMVAVGALIAKLTGIIVYGYAVGALILGGLTKRFEWRRVGFAIGALGVTFLVFGLWWFVRNSIVYDDPLGLDATLNLWASNYNRLPSIDRIHGIWVSFWMMLGHLNIPGPSWLIPYTYAVTAFAIVGVGVRLVRQANLRWYILFLLAVQALSWAVVVYITRQVNVFQGRALFMGMAAFAPLLVIGWRTLLGERLFVLPVAPLMFVTLTMPFNAVAPAFDRLDVLPDNTLPADVRRIDARAESITVHGYEILTDRVMPDGEVVLDLYFSGGDEENPIVFVTAQHPVTDEKLGVVNTHPGMVATRDLRDDVTYRARLRFLLDDAPQAEQPFQVELAVGWRTVDSRDEGQGRYLQWSDSQDNVLGGVFLAGPVYFDPDYDAPVVATDYDADFGVGIGLRGYTLTVDEDTVSVDLLWERLANMETNYTLTVGLLDEADTLVAQQDAPPPDYPTSAWIQSPPFITSHTLQIPEESNGELRLRVGWYNSVTFDVFGTTAPDNIGGMLVLRVE